MMLPIMLGLQTAVSVSELEQGQTSFQMSSGKTLKDWNDRLEFKSFSSLASMGEGYEIIEGYIVHSYRQAEEGSALGFCILPKEEPIKKCPQEY